MKLLLLLLLLATNVYAESVKWEAPLDSQGVLSHKIYWGLSDEPVVNEIVIPMPDLFYVLDAETFTGGNTYCFQMTATNQVGESQKTPQTCKKVFILAPYTPTGLTIE